MKIIKLSIISILIVQISLLKSETKGRYEFYELPKIKIEVPIESEEISVDLIESSKDIIFGVGQAGYNMYYYQSIDNGESWELLKIDELKRDESNKIIYFAPRPQDIEIIDEVIYVAIDSGRIDKSTDLGKNWERIDLEYKHSISKIKMQTKDVGIALIKDFETIPNGGGRLDYDSLLVTTDGWKTWNSIKLPNYIKKEGSGWLNNLIYSEDAIGISGPYHNLEDPGIGLYITTNNGEDWIHSKKDQLMKENALNNNILWGVSGADYDNKFRKIIKKIN